MVRRSQKLMTGWSFTMPDGNTRSVDLPHTWNGKDGQDGGNDYMRDQCIYQKVFTKPVVGFALMGRRSLLMMADILHSVWRLQSSCRKKMN